MGPGDLLLGPDVIAAASGKAIGGTGDQGIGPQRPRGGHADSPHASRALAETTKSPSGSSR